jgi:protein FAM98B
MSKYPSKVIGNRQRLINACKTLDIPFVEDPATCLSNILKKVDELRANLPVDYEGKRIWTTPLSAEETKMANDINAAFQDEYKARREMMLKRLDVTLQTLLWSEKAKLHYDEMMDIIEKHKPDVLDPGAPFHTLLDVFAAQDDLLAVQKTSHHSSVAGNKLSGILVTDVVDRGGRLGEKRKAKDMPAFAARSDSAQKHSSSGDAPKSAPSSSAPKGQRGDGGGRGRGGGRGGGHGNKRGGKQH